MQAIGWRGVVPHFRGCSGEPNRLPRAYHSGDYAEIGWMLATIRARLPAAPLYAVGVSLGGSALLNWLGREQERARSTLVAAAAVSAPLDLAAAGTAIGQGFNRIYALHFLSTLVPKALAMAQRFPGALDAAAVRRARSMHTFDDVVTAPLHGFDGAQDYWRRASSKPWLGGVAVPTLVLNARNDPFIPATSLPGARVRQPRRHAGAACARRTRGLRHVSVSRKPGVAADPPATILRANAITASRSPAARAAPCRPTRFSG